MEKEGGVKTVTTLRPSPSAGNPCCTQERRTHVRRQQTSDMQVRTTRLATNAFFITKHATLELSTGRHQASSIRNGWNSGHGPFKKLISTPESNTIESTFYDANPTATGVVMNHSSSSAIYPVTPQGFSGRHGQAGLSSELLAGGVAGGLTVLILIGLLLLAVILKRRKTGGLVLAQSNTETSFDNLGFNGGRKISEYMDLSELEIVRVKVSNTVKRKISTFTKEDQKSRRVSCGRLELVEVPANSNIDDDVLLTAWV
ncbi:hypothetical protein ACROYT_G035733 [Oculina patagonica]